VFKVRETLAMLKA